MIRELYRKGVSISEIARRTGRDRKTIRHIVAAERPSIHDVFVARYDLRTPLALRRRVLACSALAPDWYRAIERTLS